jgi:hypothetical protein
VSSFFTAAVGLTDCVGLVCEIDGAALADADVAGVVLAVAAAGVVLAVVAGVVLAVAVAGVAVALVVAGVEVALAVTGGALADAFASGVGDFIESFLLVFGARSFFTGGVEVAAGSADVFVSGVTAGAVFRVDLSCFGGASFVAGSFTAESLTAGASVFGAIVAFGFTSGGAFLSDFGFLPGGCDSSGVGCWAITAPASTSEQTVINVVNFFMLFLSWS